MDPVLLIGGTGRIGRIVVDELLAEDVPVRVMTRRPTATGLPPSVEVVAGDLSVPESLDDAFRDVSRVFLLWTAPPSTLHEVVERLASRRRRVVFLSSPHQTPHPFFQQRNPMAAFHAEVERSIASAGIESTIIRPGIFAANALAWWGPMIRAGDIVRWPYGSVETAPVDERDIAAVAALALRDERLAGGDYVVTGPDSVSQAEQVRIIGATLGRSIRFEELSPQEFRRDTMARAPGPWVDMLLNAWAAATGQPAYVSSTFRDLMGSPPRSFGRWAADHAAAFQQEPLRVSGRW
jgi:uncharacterized protein YbjT (DUF2867 family)